MCIPSRSKNFLNNTAILPGRRRRNKHSLRFGTQVERLQEHKTVNYVSSHALHVLMGRVNSLCDNANVKHTFQLQHLTCYIIMLDLTWAFNQLLIVALHQNGLNININLGNTAICELEKLRVQVQSLGRCG